MSSESKTHLAVIGGGPGGYAAAFLAADLGLEVTLIDPEENPGGVCLYRGCIPSKALLHVAKLINETGESAEWGIEYAKPKIDLDKLRDFKNKVVGRLTGGTGQLLKQRKIEHIRGRAVFLDANTLEITDLENKKQKLSFDYAILATGSRPATIPNISVDSPRVLNSTSALDLEDIPKSLLVIGGGYIGLEMGTVYAAIGSKVSVVEMMPGLLPGADRDLVRILGKRLENKFENIMLKTKVVEMKALKDSVKVTFEDEEGKKEEKKFDKVLISIGRKPNSESIGLENTCGLTENEAKEKGIKAEVMRFPWAASGRAITMDRTDGLTKLLFDPETERILGMGIAGAGAGELISEGVLAIEMAALASDIKLSIHPHPTLSETVMESAEMFFGHATHVYKPKRK
ncbi:MAG: FAD-dependent oxidoreductase [Calditrichaceae bacterium]